MNSRFDRLVDDEAREMTSGAPAPGFRARVLEHVAGEATEPLARWRAPFWLAIAGAAVVAVFASLVVFRGLHRAAEPPAVITAADTTGAVTGPAPEGGVGETVGGASAKRAPRVVAVPLSASVLEWRARVITELTAVAPLAFEEIQPKRLSITQLDVTPLGILPITFPPIGSEGAGRW